MSEHEHRSVDLTSASAGDTLLETSETLRRADLVAYADASGDQNPIHQDEAFAKSVGLPDVIAHGMLTMGLVASRIEELAQGHPIISFGTRFAAPVVVPAGGDARVDIVVSLFSRDDDAGRVTLDAAVSVAGTKVLSRTRAVIQL
ncbi:MaoC/PaaZ C-terminal domain-containing protein [Dermacoccus nishinomiyaensis]